MHLKLLRALIFFNIFLIRTNAKGQPTTFQSISKYNTAIECNCNLKRGATRQDIAASASWEKPSISPFPAAAYECINSNKFRYKIEIEDQSSKYNKLTLAVYNQAVRKELERLTLSFSQGGSRVQWVDIEGVSGIVYDIVFDDYTSFNLCFIKNGLVYSLEVGGTSTQHDKIYSSFLLFTKSLKII